MTCLMFLPTQLALQCLCSSSASVPSWTSFTTASSARYIVLARMLDTLNEMRYHNGPSFVLWSILFTTSPSLMLIPSHKWDPLCVVQLVCFATMRVRPGVPPWLSDLSEVPSVPVCLWYANYLPQTFASFFSNIQSCALICQVAIYKLSVAIWCFYSNVHVCCTGQCRGKAVTISCHLELKKSKTSRV